MKELYFLAVDECVEQVVAARIALNSEANRSQSRSDEVSVVRGYFWASEFDNAALAPWLTCAVRPDKRTG